MSDLRLPAAQMLGDKAHGKSELFLTVPSVQVNVTIEAAHSKSTDQSPVVSADKMERRKVWIKCDSYLS